MNDVAAELDNQLRTQIEPHDVPRHRQRRHRGDQARRRRHRDPGRGRAVVLAGGRDLVQLVRRPRRRHQLQGPVQRRRRRLGAPGHRRHQARHGTARCRSSAARCATSPSTSTTRATAPPTGCAGTSPRPDPDRGDQGCSRIRSRRPAIAEPDQTHDHAGTPRSRASSSSARRTRGPARAPRPGRAASPARPTGGTGGSASSGKNVAENRNIGMMAMLMKSKSMNERMKVRGAQRGAGEPEPDEHGARHGQQRPPRRHQPHDGHRRRGTPRRRSPARTQRPQQLAARHVERAHRRRQHRVVDA